MNCTKRIIEIISVLVGRTDYISVSDVADQLSISKRTIFREMDVVEDVLTHFGMKLDKKTRLGVKLIATSSQIDAFRKFAENCTDNGLDQETRQKKLIIELLKTREAKKFYYFSKLFDVSEATISYDMDKIEPWFDSKGIKLVRKPGYGVFLEGTEKQFRKAIVDFLYQNYDHEALRDLFSTQDAIMGEVLDKNTLIQVGDILQAFGSVLINHLTENAHMGLTIHLTIAIQRVKRGEAITMKGELLQSLKKDELFKIAYEIGAKIESDFNIRFPEDEIGYITMHLKGSKLKTGSITESDGVLISNFEMTRLASRMVQKFDALSGLNLKQDNQLLIGLVTHLRPAISRISMGLEIRNPLLEKIKEMYPDIFSLTKFASEIVESQYEITLSEGEVGYLAMHFGASMERNRQEALQQRKVRIGVVCASGIGTSSLLLSRLEKTFPDMELVSQLSKEAVLEGEAEDMGLELLISTIQLESEAIPVIQVNPLLLGTDIDKISKLLPMIKSKPRVFQRPESDESSEQIKRIRDITEVILSIEEHFEIVRIGSIASMKALIKTIASHMSDRFVDAVLLQKELLYREKLGSTLIHGEQTIIVHTKTNAVQKAKLALWRMDQPLKHDSGETVKLAIVMLIPENASKVSMELMGRISKALIEQDAFLNLLKSGESPEVIKAIKSILHAWLRQNIKRGDGYEF